MVRILMTGMAFAAMVAGTSSAQDADEQSRGVARVSLIDGDVSVRRGDTNEWITAAINAPLLSEDRVLTGANSRTEVQFDRSNFARLAGNAEMRLADIENRRYLVRLASGTMTWRVLRDLDAEVEISTPSIAVRPSKKGIYRVSVLGDGSTEVTVRSGEAEIYTPRGTERVRSGRTLLARGPADDPEFQITKAIEHDNFDRWSESRDRDLERSRSYQYVSRDIYGAEDLDNHGRWVSTPEYGMVWVPVTSPGWAPYRYGRWSWIDYYGWSWVSYDPWGWAPYHYGRWFNRPGLGWCWWPGSVRARHYWSPALVGFFGWGNSRFNVGFGVGFGNWGWVPLAPYERYHPWYGRRYYNGFGRGGYVDNSVNITNVNITNVYRNARIGDGYTVINGSEFGRGSVNPRPIRRHEIGTTAVVRGQLPAAPGRESLRWSDRAANVPQNPTRGDDRFYSRARTTRIDRVPFENQRAALQQISERTFEGRVDSPARGNNGWATNGGEVTRGDLNREGSLRREARSPVQSPARGENGWMNNNSPTRAELSGANSSERGEDRGGWRRIGDPVRGGSDAVVRGSMAPAAPVRSVDRSDLQRAGRGEPAIRSEISGSRSEQQVERGSWRRFGNPGTGGTIAPMDRGSIDRGASRSREDRSFGSTPARRDDSSGWGRFGTPSRGDMSPEVGSPARLERDRVERIDRSDLGRTIPERRGGRQEDAGGLSTIPDRGSRSDWGRERMGAPVVRERPDFGGRGEIGTPRSSPNFGGGGNGGGGGRGDIGTPRSSPNFGGGGNSGGGNGGSRGGGGGRGR